MPRRAGAGRAPGSTGCGWSRASPRRQSRSRASGRRSRGGASHDPLTGLPGHRSFDRVLARELSRAMRTGDSVAVGVVAVDGMAERNEADGHAAGDELLRTAAECFGGGVRPYDTVCRLGGDDFGARPARRWRPSPRAPSSSGWPPPSRRRQAERPSRRTSRRSRRTATPRPSSCGSRRAPSTGPGAEAAAASSPTTPTSSRRSRARSTPAGSSATPTSGRCAPLTPPAATRRQREP